MKTIIETVVIRPTKEMPREVFVQLHRLAFYMECMEQLPDGRRVWDDERVATYLDLDAEAEYLALQSDWFSMSFELPKELFRGDESQGELFPSLGGGAA